MTRKQTQAIAELGFASALWGFAFIASIWAMQSIGFLTVTGVRFIISAVVCGIAAVVVGRGRDVFDKKQFLLAFWPGMFIAFTLILQTWGLAHTTATKSGFITTLYILFVPLLEAWYFRTRISRWHFFFVLTSLVGVALICDLQTGNWNKGDLLTFACTFFATIQIFYFALIADKIKSPVAFNALQSFWAFLIPTALALSFEKIPHAPMNTLSIIGLIALSFGSSCIAFLLQIRAQKLISPSSASLIYLLESPFAVIFAVAFLKESLSLVQWLGVAIVMVSVTLATRLTAHTIPKITDTKT